MAKPISLLLYAVVLFLQTVVPLAQATPVSFSGQLDLIVLDAGGAVYSGVPEGTGFSGVIDDVTAIGTISDGSTLTPFSCCIAAGALSVSNDTMLSMEDAEIINTLLGAMVYSENDVVDIIDLEGDADTASGGRIEVGLSWLFDASIFSDDALSNYPFDPNSVLLSLFFIFEENSSGEDIYSAVGRLDSVSVPAPSTILLLGLGLIGVLLTRNRFSLRA